MIKIAYKWPKAKEMGKQMEMVKEASNEIYTPENFGKESFLMDFYFSMYREAYYGSMGVVKNNGGIYKILLHAAIFGPVSLEQIQDMFENCSVFFEVLSIKPSDSSNAYYHALRRIVLKGFLKKKLHKKQILNKFDYMTSDTHVLLYLLIIKHR